MTRPRATGDAGQVFPVYLTVVGGLLFLAFAYFAVGQAAVNRNGAQTAADAAALAAAQESRDGLADQWVRDVLDPTKWQDIFDGAGVALPSPCWRAGELAAQNDASLDSCAAQGLRFPVSVQTNRTAGDSVIPVTTSTRAHASAVAVIEPLCTFELPEDEGDGTEPPEPADPTDGPEGPADPEPVVLPTLDCEDGDWELNPDDLGDLPGPEDLFDVHLAD
ncbi:MULTISPECIES: pilus assembly protein TadG-related protein [unclassified Streptomyces]|uniref:pilus assembly protein TadG-related protein n=1 Tax=unclassified Streptomyces TaxID=2593676 RepID=UPI00381E7116